MSPISTTGQGSGGKVCCGKCQALLKDCFDSSISCVFCGSWFHLRCVELSKEEAELISRLESKGVRWVCTVSCVGEG